jgi:hypothetical protein
VWCAGPTPRPRRIGDDAAADDWGDDPIAIGLEFMGATAADWAGRPLLDYEGQHLEEAVASRRAAAREAMSSQVQYGLSSCGDPLTPRPSPHSNWLNQPEVREALHATMPEHPYVLNMLAHRRFSTSLPACPHVCLPQVLSACTCAFRQTCAFAINCSSNSG